LETYNKQYSTNITFKDRLVEPSLHSGLISGFTDAEGCFYGRVKSCLTSKLKRAPHLTFQISQKEFFIIKILRDIFLNVTQPSVSTCEDNNVIGQNEVIKDLILKNIHYDKS
jgi:pantothenate kinase